MGWHTAIIGKIQSAVLATGLIKPDTETHTEDGQNFDYAIKFKDLNGKLIDMENFRGKTIFINLWATWCPPCRAEMPHISSLYEKMKEEKDIAFLMVNLDKKVEKVQKYINDTDYTFPVVHASYGLTASLSSKAIPTTLVVNPEGKIVFKHKGMSNFDTEEFREFLLAQ